jgi:hypothetical protein
MFHIYYFWFALATYEALRSIRAVRRTCGVSTHPVLRCFDNPEKLNTEYLPSQHGSLIHELTDDLKMGTELLSQNLSGVWITMRG